MSDGLRDATRQLFLRYRDICSQAHGPDPFMDDRYLSMENIAWMCREGADSADILPIDKLSRWLGFVQGCLAMRGHLSVEREREYSRPLFHAAYLVEGTEIPPTVARETD
jgi:hypothetical protein